MVIGKIPDKLFADVAEWCAGDYVILNRSGRDDYIRPADMRTDCRALNTFPSADDDFSEPNRFEYQGVTVDSQGWRVEMNGYVRTTYNCYPTGGDFFAQARLQLTGSVPAVALPSDVSYLVDAIVFSYGCCFGIGLGYARWYDGLGNPQYSRVRVAFAPNNLVVAPHSTSTYTATIRRQNGVLRLGNMIEVGLYRVPEKMSIRRLELEIQR